MLAEVPAIGPVTAAALAAKVNHPEAFRCARGFAAWVGLTPKDHYIATWRFAIAAFSGSRLLQMPNTIALIHWRLSAPGVNSSATSGAALPAGGGDIENLRVRGRTCHAACRHTALPQARIKDANG